MLKGKALPADSPGQAGNGHASRRCGYPVDSFALVR